MPTINKQLSLETKYALADNIAKCCSNVSPAMVEKAGKFYFREILHSQVNINGKTTPLIDAVLEDDALHITNLVLQRLQTPKLVTHVATIVINTTQEATLIKAEAEASN